MKQVVIEMMMMLSSRGPELKKKKGMKSESPKIRMLFDGSRMRRRLKR
jgi:hypothetical protein